MDKHFPHLTVGETLEFAAATRTPQSRTEGTSRQEHIESTVQVVMAMCGLTHTRNTKVGNDYIRGVSGGERKRVSIAEMIVAGSSICAWDNSTRGLDSATAFKFVHNLRLSADLGRSTHVVAIYQASQAIYDIFDKCTVLYEGRQIYFGAADQAKAFFDRQGWVCPARQTTADFLTAVTNPSERIPRPGMEDKVPQTPEEFEAYWKASAEYKDLQAEIAAEHGETTSDSSQGPLEQLRNTKAKMQAKGVRPGSSYIISVPMQISIATKRAYQRIWNDKAAVVTQSASNIIIALIVGSLYYGGGNSTADASSRVSTLFIAILCNALTALAEIAGLYAQRPIVEKQASYRFIHPAAEAIAGVASDIPIKFIVAICFNIVLYFLSGLRREAGPFFLFFLISFISTFVMSAVFRTMAAITKTIAQAMSLAGVLVLALVIYTGFVIAPPQMHPWFGWIRWINPVYYAFEILVANEFHNRELDCAAFVPGYPDLVGDSFICSAVGAVAGRRTVNGDAYIAVSYNYTYSHVWRNFGILMGLLVVFMLTYFVCIELNSSTTSTAEMLVFQRGKVPKRIAKATDPNDTDPEATGTAKDHQQDASVGAIEPQKSIFTWKDVTYDIQLKGETRTLLDNVSGWVKPGTLTALMGVSGAGKTTLLDVLAQRTSMGVITGDMFVNGKPLDDSFQRKTGYVQQQDLHLQTSTVRESLRFSAMLRRPTSVSTEEKYEFVEEVIRMLNMEDFADAVVGVPGEGLNVEQRKLLTIGVELAAKPKLLLFLDEPTSGLDSQSSWAICSFLRKLADAGQAILCTIHQPSATLFQEFDRLLFLAKGGKTVYFGDIGPNSDILLEYFERNGARHCGDMENPAEYMLDIVNQGSSGHGTDWHEVWKTSPEARSVPAHIDEIHAETSHFSDDSADDSHAYAEFAAPFSVQLKTVTYRMFQQYWRMPGYIMAKWLLGLAAGLFIGFSFYQSSGSATEASMNNVLFGIFMVTTIFTTLVQQIQPLFLTQRALYEVRERPSKAYSWKAFMLANIVVEIPYQVVGGIITFACVYYPTAGIQSPDRQGLVLLFFIQFFMYASTFAHMTIAALPDEQTAAAVNTLLVLMSLMFCGVLQPSSAMPRFWTFMYRVSPFTYWIGGMVATELHAREVSCGPAEMSVFNPPAGQSCGDYMAAYLRAGAPGQLQNPGATENCSYCPLTVADQFLGGVDIYWGDRWRNFGIVWAFVIFNVFVTIMAYYFFRVRKSGGKKGK